MSGGSFDYLFNKDAGDLFAEDGTLQDVADMAEALAEMGGAEDAARETEELLLIARAAEIRLRTRMERLAPVWKAVEWWKSGDSSETAVRRALASYRGEG